MRNLLLSACFSFFFSILFAQVPQAIKYQAVARDSAGSIMANANITVRVSIIDSAAGGSVAYSEIHKTGTNQFGLFSISIGRGIQPSGLFANIDWATGSKWMQLDMSQNNGSTFQFVGASELLSVPYAMFSGTSVNCINRPDTAKIDYPSVRYWTPPIRECCFNPLYPDGTDGMRGVTQLVTDSTFYVVPAGKNLHITLAATDSTAGYAGIVIGAVINGVKFRASHGSNFPSIFSQPFIIMGAGDSISAAATTFYGNTQKGFVIFGYLIDAKVTPVNVNLRNGPYVVPNGKQLFMTYCSNEEPNLLTPVIQINGRTLSGNFIPTIPVVLKSGETISVNRTTEDTYLNGYLK